MILKTEHFFTRDQHLKLRSFFNLKKIRAQSKVSPQLCKILGILLNIIGTLLTRPWDFCTFHLVTMTGIPMVSN